jgi:hypothetical protein
LGIIKADTFVHRETSCARRRWLDTTYLSARLRIGRSNAGATFVFRREDEGR